ncbi:LacI family transcriptional regulator [Kribbella amoyensis]|uniref:LacI family transcriptional regulator n=1 Tax=Kribbella amoyensis TaxID=996641 RepID=A0A561BYK2_9ACTN|nr:LacI family DNA-binding transcriptional regulator [Kribbella amoyensis]TWD83974.1 LacI family transcriptional regulator [Kribbella amoyensis]
MRTRLKDVAERAGVSVKTVSNVVNGYQHVSPALRAKVTVALEELGYRPNLSARTLRRGRSGMIALALPSVRGPYFSELAHLIVREAEQHELTVLIDCTYGDLTREQTVAEGFRTQLIDGMILCPWQLGATDLRRREDTTPLVLLGERVSNGVDSVAVDSRAVGEAATEHLLSIGRQRIGVLRSLPSNTGGVVSKIRLDGYKRALAAAGLEFDPALVVDVDRPHGVDPRVATDALLDLPEPIDAIFCFNDELALVAMRRLYEQGYRVPDDIAVIGVDGIAAGATITPTLSTIVPDKQQIAAEAVRMLVERIEGDSAAARRRVKAGFTLLPRESTMGLQRVRRRPRTRPARQATRS